MNGGSSTSGLLPLVLGKISGGISANFSFGIIGSGSSPTTASVFVGKIIGGNSAPTVTFSLGNINGGNLVSAPSTLDTVGCAFVWTIIKRNEFIINV